jgi:hypothetical protein
MDDARRHGANWQCSRLLLCVVEKRENNRGRGARTIAPRWTNSSERERADVVVGGTPKSTIFEKWDVEMIGIVFIPS